VATHNLTISHWSRGQEGKGQEEQLLSRQRQHLQDLCGQYWSLQWRFFLVNCLCVLFWCGAENFSWLWIFVTFLALNFFMTVLVFFKKVVVYEGPWIFGTFAFCANPQAFLGHVHRSLVDFPHSGQNIDAPLTFLLSCVLTCLLRFCLCGVS